MVMTIRSISVSVLFVTCAIVAAETRTLVRGGTLDDNFKYWAVEDTFLDSQGPDRNFGRDLVLSGGPERTILIRFGDLERAIGRNKIIRSAKLVLRTEHGQPAKFASISRVLVPWNEGPSARGLFFSIPITRGRVPVQKKPTSIDIGGFTVGLKNSGDPTPIEKAPSGAATWKVSQSWETPITWQRPGAQGNLDAELIPQASSNQKGSELVIEGLESTLQHMLDHWYENHGLALRFHDKVDFSSSDAQAGKPQLVVEYDDRPEKPSGHITVTQIQSSWKGVDEYPAHKQPITYTAYVKNTSSVPCQLLKGEWYYRGRLVKEVNKAPELSPGSVAKFDLSVPFEQNEIDHRSENIRFLVKGETPDGMSIDDALNIDQNAYPIGIVVSSAVFSAMNNEAKAIGYRGAEDWAQHVFRFWNETLLPHSRFSFAPEGCLKRVRLQNILVHEGGDSVSSIPGVMSVWRVVGRDGQQDPISVAKFYVSSKTGLKQTLYDLQSALGLPDLSQMSIEGLYSSEKPLIVRGETIRQFLPDIHSGLMGGGDTRDERSLPTQLSVKYDQWPDAMSGMFVMPSTDLYSATDVALLQTQLGKGALPNGFKKMIPELCFIKTLGASGTPLANAQVEIFQPVRGRFDQAKVLLDLKTDAQGMALLTQINPNKKDDLTHFANFVSPDSNGLFLVRVTANGASEWGWLKSWHLVDIYARGNTKFAILPIRFNLDSNPVDQSVNLAKDKLVTDSANSLPAKLVALVSDNTSRAVTTCVKQGDWVEIDLGRDRSIGKVCLDLLSENLWPKFDILLYGTGQKPSEAVAWIAEENGQWAIQNRARLSSDSKIRTIHYSAPSAFGRYIRIRVREGVPGVELANVRVHPAKVEPKAPKATLRR